MQRYPLPHPEEIRAALAGGKIFSKVDLADAYLQLEVDLESRKYLVLSTHKGLFRFTRLPFGIHGAPAIFQSAIDSIIQGLPGVKAYLDDILVTGGTESEHFDRLRALFTRLREVGLKLKREKCEFCLPSLTYLGHIIDANGTRPDPAKVRAIVDCPIPKDAQQLRSFLGMVNYYGKFVPNLSTSAGSLYGLTKKNVQFCWTRDHQLAFDSLKRVLVSDKLLAHYDPNNSLGVSADASAFGIRAVLFHIDSNDNERPIYYASRVLSDAEKNYSQIEKEGLAIIFAMQRFQRFVTGRHFLLFTDHQPLLKIFGSHDSTPTTTSARLQRWSLFLSSFNYEIAYKKSVEHANADGLSRHFVDLGESIDSEIAIIQHDILEDLPIDWHQIRARSAKDRLIAHAIYYTRIGSPENCPSEDLRPLWQRRIELTIQDDCLLWGIRVVIPVSFNQALLASLHSGHPGVVRMKALARQHLWWPGLDRDIEETAHKCDSCQQKAHDPKPALLHPWEFPTRPWQRVHIEFAGPVYGYTWLVYVDAHSKYPGVIPLTTTTFDSTCNALLEIFSHFGLPEQLVSDNGPPFDSSAFAQFCRCHGIIHSRSSPYHPQSNGEAERFVQSFKDALKSALADNDCSQVRFRILVAVPRHAACYNWFSSGANSDEPYAANPA